MNVCVAGLWHLGTVTAACLAEVGHDVIAFDADRDAVAALEQDRPPVAEPRLAEMLRRAREAGRLHFTTDPAHAIAGRDVVWIAYDTPVEDDDRADVEWVIAQVKSLTSHVTAGTLVVISSQVPVGTTRRIEEAYAAARPDAPIGVAYLPENLRLGQAIEVFLHPDRVIAGVRSERDRSTIRELLAPVTDRIEWMSVESAEMTKHALNAFLATSVSFINEIASVCEQVGADASEVARGLKTDARIGPRAYLSPGAAFAGGTLARDVMFLSAAGHARGLPSHLIDAVRASNDAHRGWAARRVCQLLGDPRGQTIAVWGLTYKPGTDTLRRSASVEFCRRMAAAGARIRAHDPAVHRVTEELSSVIDLSSSPLDAIEGASALLVATPWPDYRDVTAQAVRAAMTAPLVLDPARFLAATLGSDPSIRYVSVGAAMKVEG